VEESWMMQFKNVDGADIVYALIETIQKNKEYLSEIDGLIGDGDHGINMNKGFTMCKTKLEGKQVSLSEALTMLGNTLVMEIGGSMGPLYGMFFLEMSKACANDEIIDEKVLRNMLNAACSGVLNIGKAKVGDKTLVDVLVPAVNAYNGSIDSGETLVQALNKLMAASESGRAATVDMVAKVGRASRLGERSRGVPDAGATSCNLILQSFSSSIIKKVGDGSFEQDANSN